jgi:hypothetical protein
MNRRAQHVASLVLPTLHLLWCLAIQLEVVPPSEGSWPWFPVFVVDLPFSMLPLLAGSGLDISPFVLFGLTGTVWWYFVSRALIYVARGAFGPGKA